MTRPSTVEERIGQWAQAYEAVRASLTAEEIRKVLAEMEKVEGLSQLQSYMSLARNVMANDRTSAVVAAMLTATGIKPTDMGTEEVL